MVTVTAVSFTCLVLHEALGVLYTSQKHDPWAQSAVALLLSLLKYCLRILYSWILQSRGDVLISVTIFEVKFFNMLYTSIFTQQATNTGVLIALLGADAIENLYFLAKMNHLGKLIAHESIEITRKALFKTTYVSLMQLLEVSTPILYILYLCLIQQHPNLQHIKGISEMGEREYYGSL